MAPTQCTPIKNNNTNINVHHAHLSEIMPTSPATPAGDKATIVINHEVKQGLPHISGSQHDMHDRSLPIFTTTGSAATSSPASSVYEEEEDEENNNKLLVGVEDKVEDTTTTAAAAITDTTDIDTAPRAAARAEPPGAPEELVLTHVRVRIQKRPTAEHDNISNINNTNNTNYETVVLRELRLPLPVTLDSMRSALTRSELGDTRRDIFFPSWTKSLYVMWNSNNEQLETIESNAALVEALDKVGDLTLLLQECRNARYSRRNNNNNNSNNMGYYYVYNAHPYNNNSSNGRKHHGKRNNNNMGTRSPFTTYRVDRPVYYDYDNNYNNNNTNSNNQALYNYMHPAALAAAYGCLLPHHVHNNNNNDSNNNSINGQAALEGASIAYMPAPFVVPFMYAPPQH